MSDQKNRPEAPVPTSWDAKQKDVGAALFVGGVAIIALLALLVWKGLF